MIGEVWFGPIQGWENVSDEKFVQHIVGLDRSKGFYRKLIFLAKSVKIEITQLWLKYLCFYYTSIQSFRTLLILE